MDAIGNWLAGVPGWHTPSQWQAIGSMGTLAVAVAAAIFAYIQVRELRQTREDQARPYVAVYFETDGRLLFLVAKNFGTTTARDVRLSLDKPIKQSFKVGTEYQTLPLFDVMPVMVPGQEWRTFFDSGVGLVQEKLHDVYTATVTYSNSRRKPMPQDQFTLDWNIFLNIEWIGEKDIDHVANALEGIENAVKSWTESTGGLAVYNHDGDAKDEARSVARADRIAQPQSQADEGNGL